MADSAENVAGVTSSGAAVLQPEAFTVLQHIEELLEQQTRHSKKMLTASRWRTVLMLIFVAAFVVVGVSFYNVLQTLTRDVPKVISEADELVVHANEAVSVAEDAVKTIVGKVDSLDIDALNESIEGIASINYKGLNTSIGGLADSVEAFQDFVDTLSTPATALGGLFGGGRG